MHVCGVSVSWVARPVASLLLVFLKGRELFTRNRVLTVTLFWLHTSTAPPPSHGCVLWAPRAHLTLGKIEDAQLMLEFRCCAESPGHRIAHLLTHLLAYETKLFARMNHDDALVRGTVLVVASPRGPSLLGAEVKRGAAVCVGGIDVGTGAQQAEDALSTPLERGNVQRGESVFRIEPIRVHALAKQFVDTCRLSTRGRGVQDSAPVLLPADGHRVWSSDCAGLRLRQASTSPLSNLADIVLVKQTLSIDNTVVTVIFPAIQPASTGRLAAVGSVSVNP
eukprot:scaffold79656_cov60-Phaeocystis_antarctica.AAC.10